MGRTKTQSEWDAEIYRLVGNEYTFLEPYKNSTTKLTVKHNVCGSTYRVVPKNFLKGNRCKICVAREKAKKFTKNHEQFVKEVHNLFKGEYTILDKYKNSATKVLVKHNICGTEYKVRPDALLRGGGCKKCLHEKYRKTNRKTTKEFSYEVSRLTEGEYKLTSEYKSVNTKVSLKHVKCGTVYEVFPYQFIRGRRCPRCNQSKGEKFVEDLLKRLGIQYEQYKKFDDLRDLNPLSYDFYLPEYNILIEYQGIQHFKPVSVFGGEKCFKTQQKHDEMKREYAKEKGYMLIEIPYTEDTYDKVKDFLTKEIKLIA